MSSNIPVTTAINATLDNLNLSTTNKYIHIYTYLYICIHIDWYIYLKDEKLSSESFYILLQKSLTESFNFLYLPTRKKLNGGTRKGLPTWNLFKCTKYGKWRYELWDRESKLYLAKFLDLAPILANLSSQLKGLLCRICWQSAMMYGSKTWHKKVDGMRRVNRVEKMTARWMRSVTWWSFGLEWNFWDACCNFVSQD